jgi:hypothetical protein
MVSLISTSPSDQSFAAQLQEIQNMVQHRPQNCRMVKFDMNDPCTARTAPWQFIDG